MSNSSDTRASFSCVLRVTNLIQKGFGVLGVSAAKRKDLFMKNSRRTKVKKGLTPAIMLVVMVLTSTCLFAQSDEGELLYEGYYTIGPEVYPDGSSYPSPFGDSDYIEIYSDHIHLFASWYEFEKITNNGYRRYEGGDGYVLVSKNYNIKLFTSAGSWGFITQEITKKGSSSTIPQNQGGNYGGGGTGTYIGGNSGNGGTGTSGGYNSPSGPKTKDCPHCHHSGKCSSCNGRGWVYKIGSTDRRDCTNCKNGECQWCNGTGSVTTH